MIIRLINFHDIAILVTVCVVWFVGCGMGFLFFNRFHCRNVLEAQKVETV